MQALAEKMLERDVTIGLTLTGRAHAGGARHGRDHVRSWRRASSMDHLNGRNLYHDTHFGLGLTMHQGNAHGLRRAAA